MQLESDSSRINASGNGQHDSETDGRATQAYCYLEQAWCPQLVLEEEVCKRLHTQITMVCQVMCTHHLVCLPLLPALASLKTARLGLYRGCWHQGSGQRTALQGFGPSAGVVELLQQQARTSMSVVDTSMSQPGQSLVKVHTTLSPPLYLALSLRIATRKHALYASWYAVVYLRLRGVSLRIERA